MGDQQFPFAARAEVGGHLVHQVAGLVQERLEQHALVEIVRAEVTGLPPAEAGLAIIATGPLTAPALAAAIGSAGGEDALAFFDAIAPIVHKDTIDLDKDLTGWRPEAGQVDDKGEPIEDRIYNQKDIDGAIRRDRLDRQRQKLHQRMARRSKRGAKFEIW